jgi:predicted MFS family arabinose efflux permease
MSGIVIACVFLPLAGLVIRNRPAEMGLLPDGDTADTEVAPATVYSSPRDWTLGEAVRSTMFWTYALPMVLFFAALISFGVHSVPFFEDRGFSVGEAALFLALAAVIRTVGRVVAGYVIDRVDNLVWVAAPVMLLHSAVLLVLILSTSPLAIAFFIVGWGLGGSFGPILTPIVIGRTFGMKSYGGILGTLLFIETMGDVSMPVVGGLIFDSTGSYTIPFLIYGAMFAASAVTYVLFFAVASAQRNATAVADTNSSTTVSSEIV